MKDYYREQVRKCEIKVALAKIGYASKILEYAEDLANANVDVVEVVIDQINEARAAYKEIREELIDYQQRYQRELDKDAPAETEADDGSN